MKPRVLLIDLHGLPHPRETLDEVQLVMPPERVLVLTALGTLTGDDVRHLRFSVIERPVTIGQIAVGCCLGWLEFRYGTAEDWRIGRPLITDWYSMFVVRPSMAATVPTEESSSDSMPAQRGQSRGR